MMMGIVGVIVIALLGGIIYFSHGRGSKKTREEFLQEFTQFVEGTIETIPEQENSFRIHFVFENENFIYEDVQEKSFGDDFNRGFLKCQTPCPLNLYFIEKERMDKVVAKDILFASKIVEKSAAEKKKVKVPASLKAFAVSTNHVSSSDELLEDDKIVKIFIDFKNADLRGSPFLSLKILEGMVTLEFHPSITVKPNLPDIHNNVASIENFASKLLPLIKKLKNIEIKP